MQQIIISVLVILFLNTTLFADSRNSQNVNDWQNVSKLRKGKTIYVMLDSGKWFSADIAKVEDDKLVVQNGAARYEGYRKEEIQEIWIKKSSMGKSIAIGAAIAVGSAVAIDVAIEHGYSGEDKYMYMPFIVMYSAPIGAGLGFLHGITTQKKDLIYKAKETIDIGNISEPHLPQINWVKKPASNIWLIPIYRGLKPAPQNAG
jgi:hypothetical protein